MRILMVVAPRNFRDEELLVPKQLFESKGWTVQIASKNLRPGEFATGMLGAKIRADLDILQAKTKDYDAVIFVGGSGSTVFHNDQNAHMLAFQAYDTGKVTAAICAATSTLANARVLVGKKATGWPSERENITAKSAGYTGEDVTVTGKVVTGKGPASARKFAEAIAKLLEQKS